MAPTGCLRPCHWWHAQDGRWRERTHPAGGRPQRPSASRYTDRTQRPERGSPVAL